MITFRVRMALFPLLFLRAPTAHADGQGKMTTTGVSTMVTYGKICVCRSALVVCCIYWMTNAKISRMAPGNRLYNRKMGDMANSQWHDMDREER
jgi:hypothetical protein